MDMSKWNSLMEQRRDARLRVDLALNSPEDYTDDELADMTADLEAIDKTIETALKADFQSLPPGVQSAVFDLLVDSGMKNREWWEGFLQK